MDGLISNALNYYDTNNDKYAKFFAKVKYFSIDTSKDDLTMSKITFYDKDTIPLVTSTFGAIGVLDHATRTWMWAWAITAEIPKNDVKLIKKLMQYGMDLDPTIENELMKTELITSRFRVVNLIQLDIHISIAAYLSKIPCIYKANIVNQNKIIVNGIKMTEINNDISEDGQTVCFFIHDSDKLIQGV
jgi:hypothetical protein